MATLKFADPYIVIYKAWKFLEICILTNRNLRRSNIKMSKQVFLFLVTYFHWWCNYYLYLCQQHIFYINKIIYQLYYIYITFALQKKRLDTNFCNKFLYKFITILSNSRQIISYDIIFAFRLYSCNNNAHLVNRLFWFCI